MQVRKQPPSQALAWMRQAINLGVRNPRAIFGAALWLMATLYLVTALLMQPALRALEDGSGDPMTLLRQLAPAFLAMMLLMPVLLGGLMHVIREAESGRAVRATGVFAPFRRHAGRLAMLGIVQLLLGIVGGVLVVALAGGDYWTDYLAAMRAAMGGSVPVMPEPEHPGLMTLVQMAFNYFSYAVMLFAIPLILFSGASLLQALKGGVLAAVRNFPANFLAGALFFGGVLLAALLMVALAAFASALGNLVHPVLGMTLNLLILLAFGAALLVVLAGGAYFAWRDTFGDDAAAAKADAVSGIEV